MIDDDNANSFDTLFCIRVRLLHYADISERQIETFGFRDVYSYLYS